MEESEDLAVKVRGAVKGYGSQLVLKGLDMNVPYGSIYGLLGSSGCGKTTLLRCILGQFSLEDGSIKVLGKHPGSAGHQVPGRDVGYMPQEMALYGDFTMSETMYYFGILHGMKLKNIRSRRTFLTNLLELPTQNKLIRTLSGGQKRRFSFAVAMLQQPPLMILDEPTVGVDPILRAKIWEHLVELVSTTRTTIVITTHYIEEARQASLVGMMREGQLLAEQPPAAMIASYRMNTLEDVFLQLCRIQDSKKCDAMECSSPLNSSPTRSASMDAEEDTPLLQSTLTNDMPSITITARGRQREPDSIGTTLNHKIKRMTTTLMTSMKCTRHPLSLFPRPTNILALCWKNLVHIYRNPGLLLFQFLVPVFQICIFSLAIGGNLEGIKVSYVNEDSGLPFGINLSSYCNNTDVDGGLVKYSNLGQLYVNQLKYHTNLVAKNSSSYEVGLDEVKQGEAWSVIYIGNSFTFDLFKRLCSTSLCPLNITLQDVTNETINGSTIHIRSDITNLQISVTVEKQTLVAYELFSKELIQSCSNLFSISPSMLSPPIHDDTPVYGRHDLSFTDYMAPGMIVSITFGISIGLCAMALIVERNEGLFDRTWVAGVNAAEIVIAQVFSQFFILAVQITLLLLVTIFAFKIYTASLANFWVIGALCMLQGLTGMAFGLFLSSVCGTETAAVQGAIAVYYPTLLLSGVLWPLEGMPGWLRYISYCLPSTLPAEAMRGVMGRGWGLEHEVVWRGFLVTIGWFLVFLFIAGTTFSLRR